MMPSVRQSSSPKGNSRLTIKDNDRKPLLFSLPPFNPPLGQGGESFTGCRGILPR
jgi:hypothetical protein